MESGYGLLSEVGMQTSHQHDRKDPNTNLVVVERELLERIDRHENVRHKRLHKQCLAS
jgi:hypothetical protein